MTITTSALESIVLPPADPATGRTPGLVSWYAESFSDRLGDRLLLFDNQGPGLELLRFHRDFGNNAAFEAAVRARVDQLSAFSHPAFVRPRAVTRLDDPHPRLALVSELAEGERLSALLATARQSGARLGPEASAWLLRELLEALDALHATGPGVHHGLLTPERVVIAPGQRLTITEYVFGDALVRAGAAEATVAAGDVLQAARLGAGVLLGRVVTDERPDEILGSLAARTPAGGQDAALGVWFRRALSRHDGFETAAEARQALDEVLPAGRATWSPAPIQEVRTASLPAYDPDATLEFKLSELPLLAPGAAPEVAPAPEFATAVAPATRTRSGPVAWLLALKDWHAEGTTIRRLWLACAALGVIAAVEAIGLALVGPPRAAPVVPAAVSATPAGATDGVQPSGSAAATDVAPEAAPAEPAAAAPQPRRPRADARALSRSAASRAAAYAAPPTPVQAGAASVIGWVSIQTPYAVRVYANGRLLGSGFSQRYRLPEGRHIITLASDEHGLRSERRIDVQAGQTVVVTLDAPSK